MTDPTKNFPFTNTPLPGGSVNTVFDPDGLSGINTTTGFHLFFDGRVRQEIVRLPSGEIWITARGEGVHIYGLLPAILNYSEGPRIFDDMHAMFRDALAEIFPECK